MEKTNVMRILEQRKIPYSAHIYDAAITDGVTVADTLAQPHSRVFKTLVTVANTGIPFVFVIPVAENLDLKKAAKTVGVKSIAMLKQRELLPLTGYIHGGCSPVGMKKSFHTTIHESAQTLPTICISAGRVGTQIELAPSQLAALIRADFADLILSTD